MQVEIDTHSGFCFGVRRAIATLESRLSSGADIYCVGDIVHNEQEIARLQAQGLKVIDSAELGSLHDVEVLFRAHGEPPASYAMVRSNQLKLTDATCPVVLKLQERIREAYARMEAIGGQVVIFGKKGHAEVIGLMGQTGGRGILIESEGDVSKIDPSRPVELFAQTTKNPSVYANVAKLIKERSQSQVEVHDTICRQMATRAEQMESFAHSHTPMIFVGGAKSSNSKVLYDICRGINPQCHFVTSEGDLRREWFDGQAGPVGIMGATSTPMWLMERVADEIRKI